MHSPERTDKKNQQKILLEKGLNVVCPHSTTRMYNLSDII